MTRLFWSIGIGAIVVGGSIAAFGARHPSTLAMWASAYLVLVMGVVQVGIGYTLRRLQSKTTDRRIVWWVWSLFNAASLAVIYGAVLKYSHHDGSMLFTVAGSALMTISLLLFGYCVRREKKSYLKFAAYAVSVLLIVSSWMGIILSTA